eukprot:306599-Rhodomonas_salina.2
MVGTLLSKLASIDHPCSTWSERSRRADVESRALSLCAEAGAAPPGLEHPVQRHLPLVPDGPHDAHLPEQGQALGARGPEGCQRCHVVLQAVDLLDQLARPLFLRVWLRAPPFSVQVL